MVGATHALVAAVPPHGRSPLPHPSRQHSNAVLLADCGAIHDMHPTTRVLIEDQRLSSRGTGSLQARHTDSEVIPEQHREFGYD